MNLEKPETTEFNINPETMAQLEAEILERYAPEMHDEIRKKLNVMSVEQIRKLRSDQDTENILTNQERDKKERIINEIAKHVGEEHKKDYENMALDDLLSILKNLRGDKETGDPTIWDEYAA